MMRMTLPAWYAGLLVSAVLLPSCSHNPRPNVNATVRRTMPATVLPPVPPSNYAMAQPAPMPVQETPVVAEPTVQPVLAEPVAQPVATEPAVQPVHFAVSEESVQRRSFADITAKPCFAHAPDYTWLSGELQYVHVRNAWRLRYASVDEEDTYGGSVTLQDVGSMNDYKNGQFVRVQGTMVNTESKEPSPAYRVSSIQPLPQP